MLIAAVACKKISAVPPTPAVVPVIDSGIQWTLRGVTYTGDSAAYTNGAYVSRGSTYQPRNDNEVDVYFASANIKSGVYPVVNITDTLTAADCAIGLVLDNFGYNSTGSSGSVKVINNGTISSITFTNVEMETDGIDSAVLSGNIVTVH
jgi:hypothetical protein